MICHVTDREHEVEVKLRYEDPHEARRSLEAIGAIESGSRTLEDNTLYDREDDPLRASKRALRLRRFGERAIVTFKGPVAGKHRYKVRVEHEVDVTDGDVAAQIFAGLGYSPRWRYQKYRTEFTLDSLHICLDETPLGCYVELEGSPAAIDAAASQLGFSEEQYVTSSYRKLLEQEAKRQGREPWDLLF